jgi:2,3-bisphosphoglycerate-dependent phosphoglycerate mutase
MQNKIGKLIIVRHGESEWNKANLFTGKKDVHLTQKGFKVSESLGALTKGIKINRVFTSMQVRSIETEVSMMGSIGNRSSENICYSSALNERDYGDYTGMNKLSVEDKIGTKEFNTLRRAWDYPIKNGETLKMVYERAVPFFKQEILPVLKTGENVLVVSHGNTIRALIKYIEKISDKDIENIEMPFNEIFIYELDQYGYMLNKENRKVGDKKYAVSSSNIRSFVQIIATIGPGQQG